MKRIYSLLFALILIGLDLYGQTAPKKYVLLEHFTNTRCGICASRNPTFFDLVHENEGDVHHISIHPNKPYEQCVFYQHNTNDNLSRAELYGIPGTPIVYVGGVRNSENGKLMSQERLNTHLNQTAPIQVIVSELEENNSRQVAISIKTYEELEGDNLTLFAAVVEKEVAYNAPNGEKEHFNVLRELLPNFDGTPFQPAAVGESQNFDFSYNLNAEWDASQVYVVAFVQNSQTKEVLNSGTKFDVISTNIEETLLDKNINIYPNPTSDFIYLQSREQTIDIQHISLYNNSGTLLESFKGNPSKIDVRDYPSGIYFVKLESEKAVSYRKVIVQ